MTKQYAIFTERSAFGVNRIDEQNELYFEVKEYTEETKSEAMEEGKKFAHLFEEKEDDYGHTYYDYITSECL